ncbi:MAG: hypothetical protein N2378_16305 [Chloroflexaceae bacterium]|nr:hypothetical protein [Chloroflexaceae bacterium]
MLKLTEAIRGDGLRMVNFFNGRLLSGEDLRQEQSADRAARELLGRAIGPGVATGLLAAPGGTPGALEISVTDGVAINGQGQTLALGSAQTVSLVGRPADAGTSGPNGFQRCASVSTGLYVAGEEFHLLALAPAGYGEGRAPVSGTAASAACATHSIVETVQFRLLPLRLNLARGPADSGRTRNLAAYALFGLAQHQAFLANPFGPAGAAPPVPHGLTSCDVPLALVQIVNDRLGFVDPWAVRRAPATDAGYGAWAALTGPAHARRAEAMLLQFQQHLASEATSLQARHRFRYLPPVGLVPASYTNFFQNLPTAGPFPIAPAHVPAVVQAALGALPIDLDSGEAIWLLPVTTGAAPAPYTLFASGYALDILARANQSRLNAAVYAAGPASL